MARFAWRGPSGWRRRRDPNKSLQTQKVYVRTTDDFGDLVRAPPAHGGEAVWVCPACGAAKLRHNTLKGAFYCQRCHLGGYLEGHGGGTNKLRFAWSPVTETLEASEPGVIRLSDVPDVRPAGPGDPAYRYLLGRAFPAHSLARALPQVSTFRGFLEDGSGEDRYMDLRFRVLFPVHDLDGVEVGFQGRDTRANPPPQAPRWYSSPGLPKRSVLYGAHQALHGSPDVVALCEGITDVLALQTLVPSVASFGKLITTEQVQALQRLPPDTRLLVAYDPDTDTDPKVQEALRFMSLALPNQLYLLHPHLRGSGDASALLEAQGLPALRSAVSDALRGPWRP